MKRVNPSAISISNDPIPEHKCVTGKYKPFFEKLKPGQCLRVPSESVGSVANALRKWMMLRNQAPKGRIQSVVSYPGDKGHGRVWLMAKAEAKK